MYKAAVFHLAYLIVEMTEQFVVVGICITEVTVLCLAKLLQFFKQLSPSFVSLHVDINLRTLSSALLELPIRHFQFAQRILPHACVKQENYDITLTYTLVIPVL